MFKLYIRNACLWYNIQKIETDQRRKISLKPATQINVVNILVFFQITI